MKTIYILGGILILIAMGAYVFNELQSDSEDGTEERSTSVFAIVVPLATDVSTAAPDFDFSVVEKEREIVDNTRVKTSETGRAIIQSEEQIVTSLDSNTELTYFSKDSDTKKRFEIITGKLWSRVERSLEQDEQYEVYTPTVAAAVRGTSFGTFLEDEERIVVSEGVVFAQRRDFETGLPVEETGVEVLAGMVLEVIDGELVVRKVEDIDKDSWYYEHNDKELEEEKSQTDEIGGVSTPRTQQQEPEITSQTDIETASQSEPEVPIQPELVEVTLSVSSVSPALLDDEKEDRISFRGAGFSALEHVFFNDREVEFIATHDEFFYVEVLEIPGDDIYDILLVSSEQELLLEEALVVEVDAQESEGQHIQISNVLDQSAGTSEIPVIVIQGMGFENVQVVRVNSETIPFTFVSEVEIRLDGLSYSMQQIGTVEVAGNGVSDTYVVNTFE